LQKEFSADPKVTSAVSTEKELVKGWVEATLSDIAERDGNLRLPFGILLVSPEQKPTKISRFTLPSRMFCCLFHWYPYRFLPVRVRGIHALILWQF